MTRARRNLAQVHFNLDLDNPVQAKLYAHIRHLAATGRATDFLIDSCVAALPSTSHVRFTAEKIEQAGQAPITIGKKAVAIDNIRDTSRVHESYQNDSGPIAWAEDDVTYAPIEDNA